ncbi:MAG: tRNA (adenosine(37)-N6)-threonylcarbamoyltransferase complex ATPase subunit type 1 TsaE, partial [Acidobacteria bacterium]|nr:tRNA (adenosine(37)-N6)-threonylcarbamoyltransferase complex ATPase subunit type 1 TsaE [Acidobacteriota bacterium]
NAGLRESVTSPTFTLVHEYRGPSITVFHIDLYRIETERELLTVGIDDLRAEPSALLLIEWADKFPSVQQDSDAEIVLERTADRERKVTYRWHSRR